jgi:hypothetical protein
MKTPKLDIDKCGKPFINGIFIILLTIKTSKNIVAKELDLGIVTNLLV